MKICTAIGNTPLIKISDQIYAKLETVNPSGSIKDRMAAYILNKAEEKGEIKPGSTIIEATSGNTGIAFSMLSAQRGYKMIVVMPCDMSDERKKMIRHFGAEIVEVGAGDFLGAVAKRDELLKELNGFNPNQFANPDNIECHQTQTAQEILREVEEKNLGEITAVVAGVGTGGTLMGLHIGLQEKFPEIECIAVEPTESAAMSNGPIGSHAIQGIGDGFIPDLVDMERVDLVVTVDSDEAVKRAKSLAQEFGTLVGISSGANVCASEQYFKEKNPDGIIITVLPDRFERYLSMTG